LSPSPKVRVPDGQRKSWNPPEQAERWSRGVRTPSWRHAPRDGCRGSRAGNCWEQEERGNTFKTFKVGPMFRRYARVSGAPPVRVGPKPGSMRSLRGGRQEYILDSPRFGSAEAPLKAPDTLGTLTQVSDVSWGRPPEPPHLPPPSQTLPTRQVKREPGEMREDMLKTRARRTRKAGTRAGPNRNAHAMLILSTRPMQGRPNKRKETGTNG